MPNTPQQAAALAAIGKGNWTVVSVRPNADTIKATDSHDNVVDSPKYGAGAEDWIITDGLGHNSTMTVKPPTPIGGTVPWPTDANGQPTIPPGTAPADTYTVVVPPPNSAAASTNTQNTQTYTTPDGTLYEKDAKTGLWAKAQGTPSGTKTPTPLTGYVPVKNDKGETVRLVDPNDPTKSVDIPVGSTPTATKPTAIQQSDGSIYSWDGSSLTLQKAATPTAPTAVSSSTTNEFIETQNPDGTTNRRPNPNYVKPTANVVATNTTNPTIVSQNPDGTMSTVPNPNYQQPIPTAVATNAADATIVQRNPTTGAIETVPNPNYKPTDPAARVSQLQGMAQAKRNELQSQVLNNTMSQDQAQIEFGNFWDSNIEPQRQALNRERQQADYNNQLTANTDQRATQAAKQTQDNWNQDFASKAGDSAVKSVMDTLPYRVGSGFGANFAAGLKTLSSGGGAVNFGANDFTYDMPDFETIRHQAVADALKGISPYAASQVGAPTPTIPQGMDTNAMLNRTAYGGSYASAPPTNPSTPTTTIMPDGRIVVDHAPTQMPDSNLLPSPTGPLSG